MKKTPKKNRPDYTRDLFKAGRYFEVPNWLLTPEHLQQVGMDGLAFEICLIKAYDNGRHRNNCEAGAFALPDQHLKKLWGFGTTHAIRRARQRVLNASPSLVVKHRQGMTGSPWEYQLRRSTEGDEVTRPARGVCGLHADGDYSSHSTRLGGPMTDVRFYALNYRKQGYSVVVLPEHQKHPRYRWTEYQLRRPSEQELKEQLSAETNPGIAIVTGALSNLVVVDIDGDQAVAQSLLQQEGLSLPETTVVETSKGRHYWFAHPMVEVPTVAGVLTGSGAAVDVRGDGGLIVAPPTIHESGVMYRFEHDIKPLPVLPQPWIEFLQQHAGRSNAHVVNRISQEEQRAVIDGIDLVDIIEAQGCSLEGDGEQLTGSCPFPDHPDKNPSFSVNRKLKVWRCFGCERGGGVYDFIQQFHKMDFPSAHQWLKERLPVAA